MAVKVKATIGIVAMLIGAIFVSVAGGRRTSSPAAFPVHGSVTDRAGAPIAGATVTVDLPKGTMSRFTDSSGQFAFPDLPAGEYEVIATAFGYNTDSYPIDEEGDVEPTSTRGCRPTPASSTTRSTASPATPDRWR